MSVYYARLFEAAIYIIKRYFDSAVTRIQPLFLKKYFQAGARKNTRKKISACRIMTAINSNFSILRKKLSLGKIRAFLYVTARHAAIDYLRNSGKNNLFLSQLHLYVENGQDIINETSNPEVIAAILKAMEEWRNCRVNAAWSSNAYL